MSRGHAGAILHTRNRHPPSPPVLHKTRVLPGLARNSVGKLLERLLLRFSQFFSFFGEPRLMHIEKTIAPTVRQFEIERCNRNENQSHLLSSAVGGLLRLATSEGEVPAGRSECNQPTNQPTGNVERIRIPNKPVNLALERNHLMTSRFESRATRGERVWTLERGTKTAKAYLKPKAPSRRRTHVLETDERRSLARGQP